MILQFTAIDKEIDNLTYDFFQYLKYIGKSDTVMNRVSDSYRNHYTGQTMTSGQGRAVADICDE